MKYDYEGVTQVRHDKVAGTLELTVKGQKVVVPGIKKVYLKSVPYVDNEGTAHLNKGRVSIKGEEAALGD